jgi:DNA mismatch repair protein MutL
LLAEWGDELLMMDQHAASERWWYEKLLKQAQTHSWDRQILLTPHLWNVTPDFIAKLSEGEDAFKRFGMVIEPMGSQTVAIKETPSFLKTIADTQSLAETLLIDLQEHTAQDASAWHATVARAACRADIMAGDSVSLPEMEKLWEDLMSCERPQTCPHGRPTYIRFPLTDFHKQFRRI